MDTFTLAQKKAIVDGYMFNVNYLRTKFNERFDKTYPNKAQGTARERCGCSFQVPYEKQAEQSLDKHVDDLMACINMVFENGEMIYKRHTLTLSDPYMVSDKDMESFDPLKGIWMDLNVYSQKVSDQHPVDTRFVTEAQRNTIINDHMAVVTKMQNALKSRLRTICSWNWPPGWKRCGIGAVCDPGFTDETREEYMNGIVKTFEMTLQPAETAKCIGYQLGLHHDPEFGSTWHVILETVGVDFPDDEKTPVPSKI